VEKWTRSRGRWSSPNGINGGGGLAKSSEIELFPAPETDEEDAGGGGSRQWAAHGERLAHVREN
jgi:hypothetical protein